VKAWKDIWGAGQGVGNIDDLPPASELIGRLCEEYARAKGRLLGDMSLGSQAGVPNAQCAISN
jgi:NAD(P)H-dependent flavin oxidoreductase YrpB (nitropropane dioxygenase family)